MKLIKLNVLVILFAVFGLGWMVSCTGMDDYLKYTGGKELVYPGKVDSVIFHSGRERVVFTGLLISDPHIRKVSIFWNNKKDSIIMDIQRKAGIDSLKAVIPLPEGTYNFQVYSYDKEGHSSIVTNAGGKSYGASYEKGLYNRPVKSVVQNPDHAVINWYNGDPTCFVRVDYMDVNDVTHTAFVSANEEKIMLPYCKPLSDIMLQTMYLPDEFAVDTFKLAPQYYRAK